MQMKMKEMTIFFQSVFYSRMQSHINALFSAKVEEFRSRTSVSYFLLFYFWILRVMKSASPWVIHPSPIWPIVTCLCYVLQSNIYPVYINLIPTCPNFGLVSGHCGQFAWRSRLTQPMQQTIPGPTIPGLWCALSINLANTFKRNHYTFIPSCLFVFNSWTF